MNNSEFSEFASKKLAPLRHDGFERASFKYFLESGTVNASFLQLIKELCDEYHEKILNGNILGSGNPDCPLCHGSGEYHIGGSFGGPITVHKCNCGKMDLERT